MGQPTEKDYQMMGKALAEARQAIEHGKAGTAALLLWRDRILALGHNEYEETGDMTAHAEIVVFRQAARQLGAMSAGSWSYTARSNPA
ncbi:tRNA(adenine34) deaminase [Thermosporothrix hazakensis]|jgi:tRNA(adenine34) deaminase|uniref:tRNA(Adenine34) deaminase n=2 Tax=Thermosporothrix TaxID=768650 RepID=A0A326UBD4_THEHA|nr:deaminase [Thermosporothrix hazakensis]PZW34511.1 tRNA(adenine34) deaminase [Thermosporothrix hazakensis]BBH85633.1 hypothetical protein KTC_03840 [Thermosporothrix sp. COM3]GCE45938.1 hypothetical protein KTH_08070 [Thermosporothrix hazakensis]